MIGAAADGQRMVIVNAVGKVHSTLDLNAVSAGILNGHIVQIYRGVIHHIDAVTLADSGNSHALGSNRTCVIENTVGSVFIAFQRHIGQRHIAAVVGDNVLGVLFDSDGIMLDYQLEEVYSTPVEARKRYRNLFWHLSKNIVTDYSENGILLYMG